MKICIFFIRDTFFIQFVVYEVLRVLWEMAAKINIKFLTFGVDCNPVYAVWQRREGTENPRLWPEAFRMSTSSETRLMLCSLPFLYLASDDVEIRKASGQSRVFSVPSRRCHTTVCCYGFPCLSK